MDLLPVQPTKLRYFTKKGLVLCLSIALTACSSSAPIKPETPELELESDTSQLAEITPEQTTPTDEIATLPLTSQLTYLLLTAEIAQQRGDVVGAAELYGRAATLVDSPAIAGRSTQIANLTRDQQRINKALNRWAEVDPTDADIYILQIPFLMLQGKFDRVVTAANKAFELAPEKSSLYLTRITDNLSKIAETDAALNVMKQLTIFQHGDVEAQFHYARLAAFFQRYEDALVTTNAVLAKQPDFEQALVLKAKTLQRLKRSPEALALLKKPANKKDASSNIRFNYAKLLGENNDLEESQKFFEQLHKENADDREVIFALGLLAIEAKDGDLAKQYFKKLLRGGDPNGQAAYFMGLTEKLNNNIEAALSWFASVPAKSPRFDAAQNHYITLLAENDQLAKARKHIADIRKANPQLAVQYYLYEATFLREQNQQQASFDLLGTALAEHPQQIDLLYGRAMAAESIDRIDILEQDLRTILEIEPKNTQALNALGYTLTDRTDRHQEALILINKALELKPNDPFYLDSLGWVYYRMGKLEQAAFYLKQAAEMQDDAEFLAHLGEVLWQQGKHDEAKSVWQQALKQHANNKLLLETMKRFGL